MRLGIVIPVLLFVILGALFGALNAERITLDFYFAAFGMPKGAALLAALLLGWLLGGLVVWLARVTRLQRQLRESRRALREAQAVARPSDPA
jgi:uncharacterized integral membrane protein